MGKKLKNPTNSESMNENLIIILADKKWEARLRTICNILHSKGITDNYALLDEDSNPTKQRYLDLVAISGTPLGIIYDSLFAPTKLRQK